LIEQYRRFDERIRVRRIGQLLFFVLIGLGLARLLRVDVHTLSQSPIYKYGAYLLLAIGLYGATYGIDLHQARHDKRIITLAVTVGVICKALIIGVSLAFAWDDPLFLILGVAVAQIDPLSVAALMGDKRMSTRARTVLAAWSSFDDPFTVVLAIYAAAVAINTFGLGRDPGSSRGNALGLYLTDLGGNLALAAVAWLVWRLIGNRNRLQLILLLAFVVAAVFTGWMLAIALIGLFARPAVLDVWIPRITQGAMFIACIALGALLIDGVSFAKGISLGIAAFVAQAIVAIPLTMGMPSIDRMHLTAAQQNGITAIILALTLQIQFDGVVAVVAPAIITANLIHILANRLIDMRVQRAPSPGSTDVAPSAAGHPDT
jgi:hypothetical protein